MDEKKKNQKNWWTKITESIAWVAASAAATTTSTCQEVGNGLVRFFQHFDQVVDNFDVL